MSKPRIITDHYNEAGTDSLRPGALVVSAGVPAILTTDRTFMDADGSSWDYWEMELPIKVLWEPGATK